MRKRTEGHRALEEWRRLHPEFRRPTDLARVVRLTPQAVSMWVTKLNVPDDVSQIILEDLAGIARRCWLDKKQNARLEGYLGGKLHAA